jgi:hypothetical protein
MQSWFVLLCLAGFPWPRPVSAQRIDALKPQVRKYVSVDTPKAILEQMSVGYLQSLNPALADFHHAAAGISSGGKS